MKTVLKTVVEFGFWKAITTSSGGGSDDGHCCAKQGSKEPVWYDWTQLERLIRMAHTINGEAELSRLRSNDHVFLLDSDER